MLTLLLSLAVISPAHAGLDREPTLDLATTYKYAGADQKQQDLDMDQIVQAILKDPNGTHYVWQPGWASWKSWSEVPELKAAVDAAQAADPVFSYSTGGAVEQLPASEIAKRIAANPSANHLAWKPGMAAWLPAGEVPEVAAAMKASAAPPPAPEKTAKEEKAPKAEKAPKEEKAPKAEKSPEAAAPEAPAMAEGDHGGASCGMCSMFTLGGEVRADVPWAYRYVNILGEEVPSDPIGAEVGRARIWVGTDLGKYASTMIAVQAAQVDDSSATDVGLGGVADGWALSAPLAYADIHYGEKVKIGGRIGAQGVAFGTNLYFQDYDNYYIGARDANQSLAQKYGVLPEYDVGLGLYVGDASELWTVDVQMLNGSGIYQTDDNFGRAIVGRAGFHPGAFADGALELNAWASGFYQVKAVDNSQIALGFDGAAELRFRRYFRVLGEVMYGGEGDKNGTGYNGIGYQIAGAGALPFEKGPMDRVEVVVADQSYNPQIGGAPVGAYDLSVGLNAYWNTEGKGTVLTGLAYEMYIPISEAEDVLHTGVLQVAAKF